MNVIRPIFPLTQVHQPLFHVNADELCQCHVVDDARLHESSHQLHEKLMQIRRDERHHWSVSLIHGQEWLNYFRNRHERIQLDRLPHALEGLGCRQRTGSLHSCRRVRLQAGSNLQHTLRHWHILEPTGVTEVAPEYTAALYSRVIPTTGRCLVEEGVHGLHHR